MSGGQDGILVLQDIGDPYGSFSRKYVHNCQMNGILQACFTFNYRFVVSVGKDGSILSWGLDDSDLSDILQNIIADKSSLPAAPLPVSTLSELKEIIKQENDPNMQTLYCDKLVEKSKFLKKKAFEPVQTQILQNISQMRQDYIVILDKNKTANEFSKLNDNDMIVDNDTFITLDGKTNIEIKTKKEQIHYDDLGKQLVTRRIKEQCWDSIDAKQQVVAGIDVSTQVMSFAQRKQQNQDIFQNIRLKFLIKTGLFEHTWSQKTQEKIPKRDFNDIQLLSESNTNYVWDVNEIIQEDVSFSQIMSGLSKQHASIAIEAKSNISSWNNFDIKKSDSEADSKNSANEKSSNNSGKNSTSTKKNPSKKTKDSGQNKNNSNDNQTDHQWIQQYNMLLSLKAFLFAPTSLHSKLRKRIHIFLLNLRIRYICCQYNKEIYALAKQKEIDIERVNEMISEIEEICKELEDEKDILRDRRKPLKLKPREYENDSLFTVKDSEIKVQKVLTAEERAEKERLLELERQRLAANENSYAERALTEMMNNTLDTKDEVERLKDTLKKPQFMDEIEESKYTDEQKIQASKYLAKQEELLKAKEIRHKLLKTRLKQLKTDVSDICKNFDNKIQLLFRKRQRIKEDVFVHELMQLHLCNDLIDSEQNNKRLANINQELSRLEKDKSKADETYSNFNSKLQELSMHHNIRVSRK